MKLKQISIFLENSPGRLYEATKALGDAGINLRALTLAEAADYGVLRLLVSDVSKARRIMMEKHFPARVDEVVAVEIEDKAGSLAKALKPLMDANISVQYMYAFAGFTSASAVMIFRFSNTDKAIVILQQAGVILLDAKAFGILEGAE
ncbi:MAG: amino acid-binding protein [Deltaproteobacteria bacterium]|nr:amino acid-binding protein [Candidatus Anaeroferrophillus wilburensis]MBN2887781.1 amino acid-binding protein [Deltaproteobacteria bacterium]